MSSQTKPSERFKQNMLILLDIIFDMFQEGSKNKIVSSDAKILTVLKILIESTSSDYMINNFIRKTHDYWGRIKERDIEYFKENGLEFFTTVKENGMDSITGDKSNSFLKNLKSRHLDNFKLLLESSYQENGETIEIFDEERKEDIWKILESFVKISISHIHQERSYVSGKYTQEYFPEINVKESIISWDIKGIKL